MENVCRTCLRASTELLSIYSDETLIYKLETIAPIQVVEYDNLPTTICEECITDIHKSYDFREIIINSDQELRDRKVILFKLKEEEEINDENQLSTEIVEEKINVDEIAIIENNYDDGSLLNDPLEEEERQSDAPVVLPKEDEIDKRSKKLKGKKERASKPMKSKLLIRTYKCTMCEVSFQSYSGLKHHKRTMHVKLKTCNICGLKLRADNFNRHVAIHSADPVECNECGKMYKNTESLRGHQLCHKGETFICEICGKQFNTKNKYNSHLKLHINPEQLKAVCKVCGKRVWDMKKHMFSHTGEKPVFCTHCNRGLSSNRALKIHMRQHTNEKPFQCNYCPMAFAQKPSLKAHLQSKHNAVF